MSETHNPESAGKTADADQTALLHLLYNPLPAELPAGNKDLLTLRAAWSGNIDRYARLRQRPRISGEFECLIRGIYHDTAFARWCAAYVEPDDEFISFAITARYIMNDDLSRVPDESNNDENDPAKACYRAKDKGNIELSMPFQIWYPTIPSPETCVKLAEKRPSMQMQAAIACMYGGYHEAWRRINPIPCWYIWRLSDDVGDPWFREDLEARNRGPPLSMLPNEQDFVKTTERGLRGFVEEPGSMNTRRVNVTAADVTIPGRVVYDGFDVNMKTVDDYICRARED